MTVRITSQEVDNIAGNPVTITTDTSYPGRIEIEWTCGDKFAFPVETIRAAINDLQIVSELEGSWMQIADVNESKTVSVTLRDGRLYADTMMRDNLNTMTPVLWSEMSFALRRAIRQVDRESE